MARGGRREGAGRPKGGRSAATKDQIANISDLAKMHSNVALNALVDIARQGESESARVSAANALLDRAFGKPQQAVEVSGPNGGPIQTVDLSKLSDTALAELLAVADEQKDGTPGD